ncbi:hypothetical protein MGSAQ_001685 [marine sediment metagenome]|uniref:Uncharacterized protein n=1 Tax=marine sediment metagenome TaxID=412755 RepID=A0A1B6NTM2_9ZZZZ
MVIYHKSYFMIKKCSTVRLDIKQICGCSSSHFSRKKL